MRSIYRPIAGLLAALALAALGLVGAGAISSPASAASTQHWTNGADEAWWFKPQLDVYDNECDGNDAYMTVDFGSYRQRYFDTNGCGGGGSYYTAVYGARQGLFCESVGGVGGGNDNCGAWKNMQ